MALRGTVYNEDTLVQSAGACVQRRKEIPMYYDQLDEQLSILEAAAESLRERLADIIPSDDRKLSTGDVPIDAQTAFGRGLKRLAVKVENIRFIIDYITTNVEI